MCVCVCVFSLDIVLSVNHWVRGEREGETLRAGQGETKMERERKEK